MARKLAVDAEDSEAVEADWEASELQFWSQAAIRQVQFTTEIKTWVKHAIDARKK